jgi:hypothetical protein
MKTIAQQITSTSTDAADAMTRADKLCPGDQNWDDGSTTWTFDDGSRLFVSEMEFSALPTKIQSHTNAAGDTYYSMPDDEDGIIYSFSEDFADTWTQEDEDAIAAGSSPSKI